MVSLAVDAVSDNRGGNVGGKGGDAVDFNNSYCPRDIRREGGDNTMFVFSGNGGKTLFWN